jgi:hypothetical protein
MRSSNVKVISQTACNETSYLAWAVEITHAMKTATNKLASYTYQIENLICDHKCLLTWRRPRINTIFKKCIIKINQIKSFIVETLGILKMLFK